MPKVTTVVAYLLHMCDERRKSAIISPMTLVVVVCNQMSRYSCFGLFCVFFPILYYFSPFDASMPSMPVSLSIEHV